MELIVTVLQVALGPSHTDLSLFINTFLINVSTIEFSQFLCTSASTQLSFTLSRKLFYKQPATLIFENCIE